MAADHCDDRVGQPIVGIDGVHIAGVDQRGADGPIFGPGVVSERAIPPSAKWVGPSSRAADRINTVLTVLVPEKPASHQARTEL